MNWKLENFGHNFNKGRLTQLGLSCGAKSQPILQELFMFNKHSLGSLWQNPMESHNRDLLSSRKWLFQEKTTYYLKTTFGHTTEHKLRLKAWPWERHSGHVTRVTLHKMDYFRSIRFGAGASTIHCLMKIVLLELDSSTFLCRRVLDSMVGIWHFQ